MHVAATPALPNEEKLVPLRATSPLWVTACVADFAAFVADHAANERKAAATAMEFVVRYPDCPELVAFSAQMAQQEISHFRQVFQRMRREGIPLRPDEKSLYARRMAETMRGESMDRRLDRILIAALMELRGLERFTLLSAASGLSDDWRSFYAELAEAERGHGSGYYFQALTLYPHDRVEERWGELRRIESAWVEAESPAGKLFA